MAKEPAKTDKAAKESGKAGKENASAVEGEEAATPPKKKSRWLLMVAVVLLLGGAGGAWFFLLPADLGEQSGEQPAEQAKPKNNAPPVFVSLEPFTVNLLSDSGSDHYLQVGIDLKVAGELMLEPIKQHMPEIRNSVLLLLSSKRASELASIEGKNKLRREIRTQVNKHLGIEPPAPEPAAEAIADASAPVAAQTQAVPPEEPAADEPGDAGVIDVLLTSFVIQ